MKIIYLILSIIATQVHGNTIFNRDEAVLVDDDYQMNCTIPDWYITPIGRWYIDGVEFFDSSEGGLKDEVRPGKYTPDSPDYNMRIRQMDYTVAGRYNCDAQHYDGGIITDKGEFMIVAIEEAQCPPDQQLSVGETLTVDCDVAYSDLDLDNDFYTPRLRWFDGNDGLLSGDYVDAGVTDEPGHPDNREVIRYRFEGNAVPEYHDMDFLCQVQFSDNPSGPSPSYEDRCTTHITVLHPVSEVEIHHDGDEDEDMPELNVGSVINCTSNGYPEVTYQWTRELGGGNTPVDGFELPVTPAMVGQLNTYRCEAHNDLNDGNDPPYATIVFTATNYAGAGQTLIPFTPLILILIAALL